MITLSIIKHLLSDNESLMNYFQGETVSFEDLKRRMLLKERGENRFMPDHHYRLVQEKTFKGISNISETLRIGLYRIAKEHLEFRQDKIFVKQLKLNAWQQLIAYIPPLLLQSAFLAVERPLLGTHPQALSNYLKNYILPNIKHTALPHPFIPQLEQYVASQGGLNDLHMHLNGSTETDIAWQDFLESPDKIYKELELAFKQPKVKEQLEQESYLFNPLKFRELLYIARKIRAELFKFIYPTEDNLHDISRHFLPATNKSELFKNLVNDTSDSGNNYENPFSQHLHPTLCIEHPIAIESLMYILSFNYLASQEREPFAGLFHFYLMILGLANRLLVQQTHQYGFEQFQKHTLNGLRENSEKKYSKRFLQLHGNELKYISYIEARVSPKDTTEKNLSLLKDIEDGWSHLLASYNSGKSLNNEVTKDDSKLPQLRLIFHFIKRGDNQPDKYIKYRSLRIDLWKRASLLALLIKNYPSQTKRIVGIDAAASEFDTPPEVFAPVFRFMKRSGIKHFTHHAGEDFHHILSGLRAVYEAVVFTGLCTGDRIGHATATGLSARQWMDAMGREMLIRQGEWLDNLIFSHHIIISENIESLQSQLPVLIGEIHKLSSVIYDDHYTINVLKDAWLMRKYCPILLFSENKSEARLQHVFNEEEWNDIQNEQINQPSRIVMEKYHYHKTKAAYEEIITIKTGSIFGADELWQLQIAVLKLMHQREIVIETLPTSNVRIGHHRDYDTYHLWNWLQWERDGHSIPPIVVGTDDTGIFGTNIYNEYANIYCHLITTAKETHNNAMKIIEHLDRNGKIYRFDY
ncbi:MAG: hypothetical protein EOO90_01920 [Pedobacter sp.]|nr:MAG: hypothetical protein EOO90_01920 [Pedobacter sp.]